MIAGIDSNIIVYAGVVPRSQNNSGDTAAQKRLTLRAKALLHNLRNDTVVLPTIAISEVLIPVPASKRGLVIATLDELFVCPEFDKKAAAIAADIWAQHKKLPADLRYQDRHVLRADCMIVASAMAAGAKCFYTHNDDCRALADLVIEGRDMPTHSEELFFEELLETDETELPKHPKKKRHPPRRK